MGVTQRYSVGMGRVPLTDFSQARRRFVADPAVRANLVVVSPRSVALRPRVVKAYEPVRVQALRPELPVQALDERVVGRLSRPGEIQRHAALICPVTLPPCWAIR